MSVSLWLWLCYFLYDPLLIVPCTCTVKIVESRQRNIQGIHFLTSFLHQTEVEQIFNLLALEVVSGKNSKTRVIRPFLFCKISETSAVWHYLPQVHFSEVGFQRFSHVATFWIWRLCDVPSSVGTFLYSSWHLLTTIKKVLRVYLSGKKLQSWMTFSYH